MRDEKILVSWNSFVLRALAEAGPALGRPEYLDAARENAAFLLGSLRRGNRLLRSWRDGEGRIPGFLEDYAALGNALLTLHEGCLEGRWLEEAGVLADLVLDLFWDEEEGLFYDSPKDGETLVVRPREPMDNATPAGSSLAVELLLRTHAIFGIDRHREVALAALAREGEALARFPSAFGRLLHCLGSSQAPPVEVVLLGRGVDEGMGELLELVHKRYLPHRIVVGGDPDHLPSLPLLQGREARGPKATAYVCRDLSCSPPLHDPASLQQELDRETSGHG